MIGESPQCELFRNCTFGVGHGGQSCTGSTQIGIGNYLLDGAPFTVVDTPGFGDSENNDNQLIGKLKK